MDNLITLIFVIIAVLSVLGKIQPKKKGPSKPANTGGWMERLNTYLTELQDKIEAQAKANSSGSSGSSGWDEIMDDTEEDDRVDRDEYSLTDLVLEDEPSHVEVKREVVAPPVRPQVRQSRELASDRVLSTAPVPSAKKVAASIMSTNRQDLRRAIIWSEIIGPPVALRDLGGHR